MKPCMICLYKNETDSAQELWNDMHTLKKLASLSKKLEENNFCNRNNHM